MSFLVANVVRCCDVWRTAAHDVFFILCLSVQQEWLTASVVDVLPDESSAALQTFGTLVESLRMQIHMVRGSGCGASRVPCPTERLID